MSEKSEQFLKDLMNNAFQLVNNLADCEEHLDECGKVRDDVRAVLESAKAAQKFLREKGIKGAINKAEGKSS